MTDLTKIEDWQVCCRFCMWSEWGWWSGHEAQASLDKHVREVHQ